MNVYEIVTQKIIEKLDQGVIPWRRPWNAPAARNWQSGKEYSGINRLLLGCGEYVTFKQCTEAGGKIKKGEKSHIAVFFKWYEKEDDQTGEAEKWPVLRYYNVFEISQCEGLETKSPDFKPLEFDPIKAAEDILTAYRDKPQIRHEEPRAYYVPALDYVNMPRKERFKSVEDYYSTLFHELVHSTGHETRLNRKESRGNKFGSAAYSREELVAEIGAAMLCGVAHIDNATLDNSAAYIDSWRRALKADCHLIITAAQQAQKAANYIRGIKED